MIHTSHVGSSGSILPSILAETPRTLELPAPLQPAKNFAIRTRIEEKSAATFFNIACIEILRYAGFAECPAAYVVGERVDGCASMRWHLVEAGDALRRLRFVLRNVVEEERFALVLSELLTCL